MLRIFVEKYKKLSDEELITKIRDNNQEAFETLFVRHLPRINFLVSKNCTSDSEKEDMFQDATISFYYATQMFDFHSSSQKRIPSDLLVPIDDTLADNIKVSSAEEEFFDKDSLSQKETDILSKLSKKEVLVLKSFLKTGSYDATAKELSISRKSVDNALVRIRRKLNQQ